MISITWLTLLMEINLLKKESETEFSKEFKKIFPDSELVKIEKEN